MLTLFGVVLAIILLILTFTTKIFYKIFSFLFKIIWRIISIFIAAIPVTSLCYALYYICLYILPIISVRAASYLLTVPLYIKLITIISISKIPYPLLLIDLILYVGRYIIFKASPIESFRNRYKLLTGSK